MSCCCCSCECYKTICAGEAYGVSNTRGEVDVMEGPCSPHTWGRSFYKLTRHRAGDDEYLIVQYQDGRKELQQGPTCIIQHPVDHVKVQTEAAIKIGDQEVLVVYRAAETGMVSRHIIQGPSLYIPKTVSEWVHEFSWTGPAAPRADDVNGPNRKKIDSLKFTKLRVIPGKMYFDVEGVRTKDNALITVKLMLFYHLVNVEQMLDNTNDPIGDFINSVSADVIEWCSTKKFDEFLANTDALNTLTPYAQLQAQVRKVGFELTKMVFRGYDAPAILQRMHDQAIENRTALSLAAESAEEEQKLADFKLSKESERAAREAQLEMERLNNDIARKRQSAEADIAIKKQIAEAEIDMKKQSAEADHLLQKEEDTREVARFAGLMKLDSKFDIAKYMMSRELKIPTVVQCGTLLSPGQQGMDNLPMFSQS